MNPEAYQFFDNNIEYTFIYIYDAVNKALELYKTNITSKEIRIYRRPDINKEYMYLAARVTNRSAVSFYDRNIHAIFSKQRETREAQKS